MDESSTDFREADHPSPDRWLAYHRGELADDEAALLEEHLVRCRDCFDLSQAAEAFARPDAEPDASEEVASAALWRLLRPELGKVREISSARPPRPAGRSPWMSLAASFFIALVGLGAWSAYQQREARAPQADVPIIDFLAGERLAGSEEKVLSASARPMFVFHPSDELPAYRLVIRDAATGREIFSHVLKPDPDLALNIHFPKGLPAGRYRLELRDGGPAGKVLEEHRLRVTE